MTETSGIGRRRALARTEGNAAYREKLAQIVQAAVLLFKEKGYEGTTLNDIAAAVGTDRASLYYYVASKEELLREAARDVTAVNTAAAQRISRSSLPAADKIQQFMTMLLTSYEANYPQVFVFIGQDLAKLLGQKSPWAKSMVRQVRLLETLVVDMLNEGIQDGSFRSDLNVEYAAKAIWGMLNWTHQWYRPGPSTSAEAVAATFATIFLDGFSRKPARR
jgi:AcrR family transcriptional regulator